MSRLITATVIACAALATAGTAAAQDSNFVPLAGPDGQAATGWIFTPAVSVGSGWDDNILVRGQGDVAPADVMSLVSPRGTVTYNSGRGQMAASYDGNFALYREFDNLDSFDQRASFFGRRLIKKHVALFVRNSAASVPTTEIGQLVGVPFIRTGSRLENLSTGVEAAFTKYTSAVISYDFEWVDFSHEVPGSEQLQGGHSHGFVADLKHLLNARLALTARYDLQLATLRNAEDFTISNGGVGVEYRLYENTRVYASGGLARLYVSGQSGTDRTGPAVRMGLTHTLHSASVDVYYSRSYVPSYGFGGTMQNRETTGRLTLPAGRRVTTSAIVSWRQDDPLDLVQPSLRSVWVEGTVGYAATRWVRIEGFFAGTHQNVDRPGGVLNRNRLGVQVVTAKPMRIH